jgi:hypothetical protein
VAPVGGFTRFDSAATDYRPTRSVITKGEREWDRYAICPVTGT